MLCRTIIAGFAIFYFSSGCKEEIVPDIYKPSNKHQAYLYSLKQLNLDRTALGKDWIQSAEIALVQSVEVETPFEEAFYLDPGGADALGYRFSVKRGQKVVIDVYPAMSDSVVLFIDLFRVVNDSLHQWHHVATADEESHQMAFESRQNAEYIIRLQPELLRGGKYSIIIKKVPTLAFPVAGKNSKAIGSFFGDPRDGGRRDHHGVDIFAKRYTPVIAPTKGYVRFVGERNLGGNVIWINDVHRGQNLYFAHLQEQWVQQNTWVEQGDTIGTVGNTGNAKYTPTHLHFGIYSRGPQDPYYYIKETDQTPDSVLVDNSLIGQYARSTQLQTFIANKIPSADKIKKTDSINAYQVFKVVGAFRNYYKIRLPDHNIAYLKDRFVESISTPLDDPVLITGSTRLLAEPDTAGYSKETLKEGEQLDLLGQSSQFWWVKTSRGKVGWITKEVLPQ